MGGSSVDDNVSRGLEGWVVRAFIESVLQSDRKTGLEIEKLLVVAPGRQRPQLGDLARTERVRNLGVREEKKGSHTLATHTPPSRLCCFGISRRRA